jgi:hypothetical protein
VYRLDYSNQPNVICYDIEISCERYSIVFAHCFVLSLEYVPELVQLQSHVKEPQDAHSEKDDKYKANSASTTSNYSSRATRISSLSNPNDGDDGGEKRPPLRGGKVPSQCEVISELTLIPSQVVSSVSVRSSQSSLLYRHKWCPQSV